MTHHGASSFWPQDLEGMWRPSRLTTG
jgi:hypothetical protein